MKKGHTVSVLDKGWIELQDVMGDDLAIVNAARTSMLGESKGPEQDKKLLFYLMSHGHTSPFEQCLSGDTLIPTFPCVGAKQKYYSMEQLAEAFGRMSKSDAWAKLVNIRTVNANGVVEPTRIKNVRMTGVKKCWRVTEDSALNRSIVVTDDHPFLRPDGSYSGIRECGVGSEVMINGTVPVEVSMWHDMKLIGEIAEVIGKSETSVYRRLENYGVDTSRRVGFRRKKDADYLDPRALARRIKTDSACEICGGVASEVHHLDKNPHNNGLDNLLSVCGGCHKAFHNPSLPKIVYPRKIKSIEYAGEIPVYDLETESDNHNFVAGRGFVVHNCEFKFRVKAPVVTWWQWARHRTWNFNAQSGRYTEFEEDDFYIPTEWRLQSKDNKQGSEGVLDKYNASSITAALRKQADDGFTLYRLALNIGIAKEQARLFLPAWCSYYTWVCKVDAHNLMHFLKLRMAKEAQYEIRVYAQAIYENFFKPLLPWTAEAFEKFILKGE